MHLFDKYKFACLVFLKCTGQGQALNFGLISFSSQDACSNLYNNLWKLEEASLLKMPTGLTSQANMFDKVRLMMCSTFSISIGVFNFFMLFCFFISGKGLIGNCPNCLNLQMTGLPTRLAIYINEIQEPNAFKLLSLEVHSIFEIRHLLGGIRAQSVELHKLENLSMSV